MSTMNEEREALLTAYALNQLSGEEQAAVEASLAADPAAEQYVRDTRKLAGIVEEVLGGEAAPEASVTLRKSLDQRLSHSELTPATLPPERRWLRRAIQAAVIGGALCTVGALLIPPIQTARETAARNRGKIGKATRHSVFVESNRPFPVGANKDASWETQQSSTLDTHVATEGLVQDVAPGRYWGNRQGRGEGRQVGQSGGQGQSQGLGEGEGKGDRPQESQSSGVSKSLSVRVLSPKPQSSDDYDKSGGGERGRLSSASEQKTSADRVVEAGRSKETLETRLAQSAKELSDQTAALGKKAQPRVAELHDGQINQLSGIADGDAGLQGAIRDGYSAEQYDPIVENAFLPAKDYALSTFSIDVDTASYANVRRFLSAGSLPPPSAVRIEEMINYFTYDDPQPAGNAPFSVNMELAECPWTPGHHLLRVGLKGKEIAKEQRPNSNLVFLLDVSGSMQTHNKLPLVKQAMQMLTRELTENDMVTIVVYAGNEGLALDTTSGDQQEKILAAIENLSAGGSTHASAGITLAYEMAQKNFLKEGTNRVILCTDGDFNVGITDDNALVNLITDKAKSGVFLSVLGFGMGNLKDAKMEKLADKGNGNYGYIDTAREAKKVLVEQMSGSLITIAKDVKIQIEFNPAVVAGYRQIGYENRVLAAKDFDDDTKDAGEIGAGHSVTALYEVVLVGNEEAAGEAAVDGVPLKYQKVAEKAPPAATEGLELTEAASSGELCTVKLRFKAPTGEKSELVEYPLKSEPKRFGEASENLRFASAVASFGMLLRNSEHRGGATLSAIEEIASASLGKDPHGYRAEFLELVRKAEALQRR